MSQPFTNNIWVENNFEGAEFRDKRLTDRLVIIANGMGNLPNGSIPQQMDNWNDAKSCYAFMRNKKVSHKKIQMPHRARVKKAAESNDGEVVLFPQDTSELDYTNLKGTKDLGFIGNHMTAGIMFHSCLAVKPDPQNPKVLGLAHQQVWERKHPSLKKAETRSERNKREKESDVWLKNIKAIGTPPEGCTWVSVGDRANDIFLFCVESIKMGWEFVFRASQDRVIKVDQKTTSLMTHMRSLHSVEKKLISMRKVGETKIREIEVNVAWSKVEIQPPQQLVRKVKGESISVVRCWNDDEEIDWILYSSIPVTNLEEAFEKIEWYATRWIIEEYHKCLKTGCRIESSQLESCKGLENLLGILGVIAILMLQLRNAAREDVDRPASEFVDKDALMIICERYKLNSTTVSIGVFWRSVARLGGFLGRRSDGEPGWQILWKGWLRLLDMLFGCMYSRKVFEADFL